MRLDTMFSSQTCQWETPRDTLAAIEQFLGADYFDPRPFTDGLFPAFDGLSIPWGAHSFCNPPYGRSIGRWTRKALEEYRAGNSSEIVLLVPARTDTRWMQPLLLFPVCFLRGRLHFSGHRSSAPFPSALVYIGTRGKLFLQRFSDLGVVTYGAR